MCLNKMKTSVKNNGEKIHDDLDNRHRDTKDMKYFTANNHILLLEYTIIVPPLKIKSSRAVKNTHPVECGTSN